MAKTDSTPTKRPRKSASERAQADLDAAMKRRDSAVAKLSKAEQSISSLRAEAEQAEREVSFRSQNPALPQTAPAMATEASSD